MIHLNIGSNKGDRHATLLRAVALLEQRLNTQLRLSAPVETAPWGFSSDNTFVNIGAAFDSSIPLTELLNIILDVQNGIDPTPHRDAAGGYVDRTIDIDLIAADDIIVRTSRLTLPHPRMHLRDFVLRPMAELEPTWRHPLFGLTPEAMLIWHSSRLIRIFAE